MKVAFLMPPREHGGGIATAAEGLSAALQRGARIQPMIFTLNRPRSLRDYWNTDRNQLVRRVLSAQPSLVHTHGLWVTHSRAGNLLSHRHQLPEIVSPHGMLDQWVLQQRSGLKKIAWMLSEHGHLRRCTVVHALCEAERKSIAALGIRTPIAVVPNGVNLPEGIPSMPPPWREAFEPGTKVLLFLGRLHAKKGLEPLLQAWSRNRRRLDEAGWRLALIGWDDGGYAATCVAQIRALNLERTCRWFGPALGEGKASALASCDAFILPSFSEGLPMAVLEAWSYRKPVFMTAACNLPEGFTAGAALEVATDSELLAEQLWQGLEGAGAAKGLLAKGAAGFALAQSRFNWTGLAAQFGQLYEWVAGVGSRPEFVAD
jgi:poly(glycerol-phosphate) alpha-glucosyltransferase